MKSSAQVTTFSRGSRVKRNTGARNTFSFPFGLPRNISAPAAEFACANYENVFSAYRGGNFHSDDRQILKRGNFPHTVWELELQLQSVLAPDAVEPSHLQARVGEAPQVDSPTAQLRTS